MVECWPSNVVEILASIEKSLDAIALIAVTVAVILFVWLMVYIERGSTGGEPE